MGARANLILIRDRKTRVFYTHWRANSLPRDLFWGPDHATTFTLVQKPLDGPDLLDDIWAEGGAVIDWDSRRMILFGGEDISRDVPMRRVYFDLLRHVWQGWNVGWALEGVADLADYVGIPRAQVLSKEQEPIGKLNAPPPSFKATTTVASFRFSDGSLRFFRLMNFWKRYLAAGPALLVEARGNGFESLDLSSNSGPSEGFHIDEARKQLEFWTGGNAPDALAFASRHWPGWEIVWHREEFEFQLERGEGHLKFRIPADAELIEDISRMLLYEEEGSPVDMVMKLPQLMAAEGVEATMINPDALREAKLTLPLDYRRGVLEAAIAARARS